MQIKRSQLEQAVQQNILSQQQVNALWLFVKDQNKDIPSFQTTHILYYFGALIAIGAMTLFMNLGWESFGGIGLCIICFIYAAIGIGLTNHLLYRHQLIIPAGALATLVVCLVPLAVFGIQSILGYWDGMHYRDYYRYIDWRWLTIELATLLVGVGLVYIYRLPFLIMPIAFTLWYTSMDLGIFIIKFIKPHNNHYYDSWQLKQTISVWFGVLMIMVAFIVDLKNKSNKDFAFWLYIFGVITFRGALSSMNSDSELNKFLYCCINIMMIIMGAMLSRKIFVIFGGLGVAFYLSYLSYRVFKDSLLFPFALTMIGLVIIGIGIYWQKHEKQINQHLQCYLPKSLKQLLDRRAH